MLFSAFCLLTSSLYSLLWLLSPCKQKVSSRNSRFGTDFAPLTPFPSVTCFGLDGIVILCKYFEWSFAFSHAVLATKLAGRYSSSHQSPVTNHQSLFSTTYALPQI